MLGRRHIGKLLAMLALALGCQSTRAPNGERPAQGPPLGLELFAEGFTAPVALAAVGDGSGRVLVADQIGLIHVLDARGRRAETPALDLTDVVVELSPGYDERGLLGLALHPRFAENRRVFVYYSARRAPGAPAGFDHTGRLSELTADPATLQLDRASERVILEVDEPQANHNGGQLAFGPDGFLYLGLGDGGGAGDRGRGHAPEGNAQNLETLLGKIVRLDVDGAAPYAIPEDNPFVGTAGRDEIYAYGFRNPYRFSFGPSGELLAGDVGQALVEEVDQVERGGNYGWNVREGSRCFDPARPENPPDECPDRGARGEPLIAPILEYGHPGEQGFVGTSVIGGYIYRGEALPELRGQYVFGDLSRSLRSPDGSVFVARRTDAGWTMVEARFPGRPRERLGEYLFSFGEGADGALYLLTSGNLGPTGTRGKVYRLTGAAPPS